MGKGDDEKEISHPLDNGAEEEKEEEEGDSLTQF